MRGYSSHVLSDTSGPLDVVISFCLLQSLVPWVESGLSVSQPQGL